MSLLRRVDLFLSNSDYTWQRFTYAHPSAFLLLLASLGGKRVLWKHVRALFYGYRFEAMRDLLEALLYGHEKHRPILITDSF
jgi:hypothetical protein